MLFDSHSHNLPFTSSVKVFPVLKSCELIGLSSGRTICRRHIGFWGFVFCYLPKSSKQEVYLVNHWLMKVLMTSHLIVGVYNENMLLSHLLTSVTSGVVYLLANS